MCHSAEHAAATRQQLRNYKRLLAVLLWPISEQSLKRQARDQGGSRTHEPLYNANNCFMALEKCCRFR
jgi:hypothetical protein